MFCPNICLQSREMCGTCRKTIRIAYTIRIVYTVCTSHTVYIVHIVCAVCAVHCSIHGIHAVYPGYTVYTAYLGCNLQCHCIPCMHVSHCIRCMQHTHLYALYTLYTLYALCSMYRRRLLASSLMKSASHIEYCRLQMLKHLGGTILSKSLRCFCTMEIQSPGPTGQASLPVATSKDPATDSTCNMQTSRF